MIDIRGNSKDPRAARLSNFTPRSFVFDGVECSGVEGLLQSLKCANFETQKEICALGGRDAKRRGEGHNDWKRYQLLWWNGKRYVRSSQEYCDLITRIYDTVYEQDESIKEDLLAIGHEDICHSIGNPDMSDTVLTEVEMIHQLNRLRIRVLRDHR